MLGWWTLDLEITGLGELYCRIERLQGYQREYREYSKGDMVTVYTEERQRQTQTGC